MWYANRCGIQIVINLMRIMGVKMATGLRKTFRPKMFKNGEKLE